MYVGFRELSEKLMVELHIKENEVQKYLYFMTIFNTLFPKILDESEMVIYITDKHSGAKKAGVSYDNFINLYDDYGLNQVAQ